jgi:hypothetical protein
MLGHTTMNDLPLEPWWQTVLGCLAAAAFLLLVLVAT